MIGLVINDESHAAWGNDLAYEHGNVQIRLRDNPTVDEIRLQFGDGGKKLSVYLITSGDDTWLAVTISSGFEGFQQFIGFHL